MIYLVAVKKREVTDIFLYKWRYVLGYIFLALSYVGAVIVAAIYAPGGLTQAEIDALSATNSLGPNLDSLATPNLPFHLLQLAFFKLFGVSILTIKAPAIIFSVISSLAIFFLLRRWFKPSIAILSLLIMTTTAQFLFIGQSATASILYVAYTALILLFATLVLQRARASQLWRIGLALTVSASLFTPYFWYINLGLLIIALLHPHPRHYLIAKKHRNKWLVAIVILMLMIGVMTFLCLRSSALLNSLAGLDLLHLDLLANLRTIYYMYFRIEISVIGGQITPIMDWSALFLIILGLAKSFSKGYSARAFMVWTWLLLSLVLVVLQPQLAPVVLVPLFILLAVGIETLLDEWYKLFPRNPYARGTGLLLISALISVMVIGGAVRYIDGYRYYPAAVSQFNKDLDIIKPVLADKKASLLVSPKEVPLYTALAKYDTPDVTVSHYLPRDFRGSVYVSHDARHLITPSSHIVLRSIVVNSQNEAGDRFYLYTIGQK